MVYKPIINNRSLCYMDSGTSVWCGYVSMCRIHLIHISRTRGRGKIFILEVFLLVSRINGCLLCGLGHSMHFIRIISTLQCKFSLRNMFSR